MMEEKVIHGPRRHSFKEVSVCEALEILGGSRHDPCFPPSSHHPTARQWAEWKEEGAGKALNSASASYIL